jgi:conjugative transposon TraN protein
MKTIVCLICAACLINSSFAQTSSLCIATDKTTSLIFPFAIKHVDRGTKDVLVQPIKEADNILLVKAAANNFSETNLSVVTADGSVYSFAICYGSPETWVYHVSPQSKTSVSVYAGGILDNSKTMHGIKDHSWDIAASVAGIYIKENVIYYQLSLENQSPIDYDIDFLRFYIRDKKKSKRTATQENELTPLYIAGNIKQVKANSTSAVVVALEKFTIPDAKYLAIETGEKNGGRHLFMKVNNNKIIKAIPLADLK